MITVKDIFRHGENYLNKEIELFGWVRKIMRKTRKVQESYQ